jgi:integrase/recombinase XerD
VAGPLPEPEPPGKHVFALKDIGLGASSIRRAVSAFRTYFGFLIAEGHLAADPSDRLEMPRQRRRLPDSLSVAEALALLGTPSADDPLAWRDRALLELAYGAGLRVSELCGLTVPNLLLSEGLVRVMGKGKERLVPIGRRSWEASRSIFARIGRRSIAANRGTGSC